MSAPDAGHGARVVVWFGVDAGADALPAGASPGLDGRAARHQRSRAAAHRTARLLVAHYTGCPPQQQRWSYTPAGRPLVDHPAGLHVSLSHADAITAAALSWDSPVGVDVEPVRPLPGLDALAREMLSDGERRDLDAAGAASREALFLRFWTRKEAVAKAIGTGLAADLRAIVTTADGALVALPAHCGAVREWSLADLPAPSGAVAALALRAPAPHIETRVVRSAEP
ncbi:MAG TPA: 4'-phosphopantetheinyl transferase superfamily protein [Actinocrinis sp.]|uniref:4'-phosphopantetheinyl transferase family protein n=1 Tax=Actinocrinis sp. TaxID=1920516 RepID=UPI002DDCB3C2|nr:4'-phosphopantetheinyl transferase superfamily protein [Actinocrinis sp.]HEV2343261.1 4'-phosphopantetheinyl transferase superfamily protein [Actinocrinis sp.]